MTITEFLLARIADDERELGYADLGARMWREREARRAIATICAGDLPDDFPTNRDLGTFQMTVGDVLLLLAAIYSDHPDYDPSWAAP